MFKSTFHSHSRFDDGKEELEAYIKSALEKGFKAFGFSAHAPVLNETGWNMKMKDFEEYVNTTKILKNKYKDKLEIYTGLETDFYEGSIDWRKKEGIEYTIGAVHFLVDKKTNEYLPVDGTPEEFEETLNNSFGGDIKALVSAYYGKIREMLLLMKPDIVAHLDVIRKNNKNCKYFKEDDDYYMNEVYETLKVISSSNAIVEVNTGGISRGYVESPYPSRWILEACLDMNIPVIVNSDCHHPEHIDFYYEETYDMLKDIGFKYQRVLYRNEWRDVSL
ncbi:MAG: histidinol-phosphatase [Clostridiaceae bacterium]|nr:histidinol-phosphatase [Clostridiaceae bacterium]